MNQQGLLAVLEPPNLEDAGTNLHPRETQFAVVPLVGVHLEVFQQSIYSSKVLSCLLGRLFCNSFSGEAGGGAG